MTLIKEADIKVVEDALKAKETELADIVKDLKEKIATREDALSMISQLENDKNSIEGSKKDSENEKADKEKLEKEKQEEIDVLQAELVEIQDQKD